MDDLTQEEIEMIQRLRAGNIGETSESDIERKVEGDIKNKMGIPKGEPLLDDDVTSEISRLRRINMQPPIQEGVGEAPFSPVDEGSFPQEIDPAGYLPEQQAVDPALIEKLRALSQQRK